MSLKETLKMYKFANKQRDEFYNVKWRLFLAVVIIVVMWFAYTHIQTAYPSTADRLIEPETSGTIAQANERLLNWFVTGFLVGFLAFALMFEGEFVITSFKIAKMLSGEETRTKRRNKGRK